MRRLNIKNILIKLIVLICLIFIEGCTTVENSEKYKYDDIYTALKKSPLTKNYYITKKVITLKFVEGGNQVTLYIQKNKEESLFVKLLKEHNGWNVIQVEGRWEKEFFPNE